MVLDAWVVEWEAVMNAGWATSPFWPLLMHMAYISKGWKVW